MITTTIKAAEYIYMFQPRPEWVLVRKHRLSKTITPSGIVAPDSMLKREARWSPSGTIVAKNNLMPCSTNYRQFLYDSYKIGLPVGYNSTHPIEAPIPVFFQIEDDMEKNPQGERDPLFVMLHVEDILGSFHYDETLKNEEENRLKKLTEDFKICQAEMNIQKI